MRKPESFFARRPCKIGAQDPAEVREIVFICCFIKGDADRIFIELPQIYPGLGRISHYGVRIRDAQGIEKIIVRDFESSRS